MQECFARTRWAIFTPLPVVGFKLYKLQSSAHGGGGVKANGHHESDDKRKKTPLSDYRCKRILWMHVHSTG